MTNPNPKRSMVEASKFRVEIQEFWDANPFYATGMIASHFKISQGYLGTLIRVKLINPPRKKDWLASEEGSDFKRIQNKILLLPSPDRPSMLSWIREMLPEKPEIIQKEYALAMIDFHEVFAKYHWVEEEIMKTLLNGVKRNA